MQSETEIILLTSNNMEGNGCKSFIELNKPGCKISLMLLSSDYDFDCFNFNGLSKNAIVIFDFDSFKNDNALFFIQKLTQEGIRTIIYSQLSTAGLILKAKQHLISGYVSKHSSPDCLLSCINVLELGGFYYDPIFSDLLKKISSFEEELSLTQRNVVYEVLSSPNKSLKEIAAQLDLSKHTAEVHLSNIYHKANVNNYSELLTYFSL